MINISKLNKEFESRVRLGIMSVLMVNEWVDFTEMKNNSLSMTFGSFVKIYMDSMQNRLKENTLLTKQTIIEKKFLPYFKDKKLCDITPKDVIYWQNEMMKQKVKKIKNFLQLILKQYTIN